MQELIEISRALANQPDAVSVRFQRIHNFHKLIVDELPYGQIDPKALVQGLIEFDGPAAQDPANNRKPLQWHFGGTPYEVCKAIRIQYSYQKYFDGMQLDANGSLFIGYESSAESDYYANARKAEVDKAAKVLPTLVKDLLDVYRDEFVDNPSRVTALAMYVTDSTFDDFIEENIPGQSPANISGIRARWQDQAGKNSATVPQPTKLGEMFDRPRTDGLPGARIECDGPAREYYSHKAFPYTTETLFNDPSGLYNRLLWWYFGGRAFRITKAMRLPYADDNGPRGALLIGYQGPGPA